MAKITEKEMETILQNEIPLDLEADSGIFEFHECGNVSIGVSYEHVGLGTHCVGYIFNLFVNGEYINIPGSYNNICEATKVLTEEWNRQVNKSFNRRMEIIRMQNNTEIINIIEKSWGVNSIGCPFGSCTEKFANEKMIEIANKNNFPNNIIRLIKDNPIKFHKYQKFDNGRGIGRYYANLIRQTK